MAILAGAALLLFGPEQLPRVMRKAGSVMREVQNTSSSFIREMERAADLHEEAEKKPYDATAYDPAPYDASSYADTTSFEAVGADARETSLETVPPHANGSAAINYEPAAPDPERPAAEKFAEPRPAIDLEAQDPPQDVEPFEPPPRHEENRGTPPSKGTPR
jgi:Sec-independent protein translocase protein TatA